MTFVQYIYVDRGHSTANSAARPAAARCQPPRERAAANTPTAAARAGVARRLRRWRSSERPCLELLSPPRLGGGPGAWWGPCGSLAEQPPVGRLRRGSPISGRVHAPAESNS